MQSYLRLLDCRFHYIERASGRHKEACCGLETRCRYPAQGRGPSLPRREMAARGRHSELLVSTYMPEPLSDKRRTRCDPAHATGNGHYGYSPFNPEALIAALRTDQAGKARSGISGNFLARRLGPLRSRLHGENGRILWLQWRGVCRDLPRG
jgi:hypothetical protein